MSYDISILSQPLNVATAKPELLEQLTRLGWIADSENHLVFQIAGNTCADMDLAWAEDGDFLEPKNQVNRIQVHIPYGFLEAARTDILKQCRAIAELLNWQAYDEQEGQYLG